MALPTRVNRMFAVDPFEAGHRIDTALNRFFGGGDPPNDRDWAPFDVDVREDADHLYVEAELPGFKKDEVDITLENQMLTITAAHKSEKSEGEKGGEFLLRERRYSRFLRSFNLPPTIDDQKVDARLNDGVLTVTLKKREESKPRRIHVG